MLLIREYGQLGQVHVCAPLGLVNGRRDDLRRPIVADTVALVVAGAVVRGVGGEMCEYRCRGRGLEVARCPPYILFVAHCRLHSRTPALHSMSTRVHTPFPKCSRRRALEPSQIPSPARRGPTLSGNLHAMRNAGCIMDDANQGARRRRVREDGTRRRHEETVQVYGKQC